MNGQKKAAQAVTPETALKVLPKHSPIVGGTVQDDKAFKDLQAGYAFAGHQLRRSDAADGPTTYYATRWGLVQELPTLADAARFLLQIGGQP